LCHAETIAHTYEASLSKMPKPPKAPKNDMHAKKMGKKGKRKVFEVRCSAGEFVKRHAIECSQLRKLTNRTRS